MKIESFTVPKGFSTSLRLDETLKVESSVNCDSTQRQEQSTYMLLSIPHVYHVVLWIVPAPSVGMLSPDMPPNCQLNHEQNLKVFHFIT